MKLALLRIAVFMWKIVERTLPGFRIYFTIVLFYLLAGYLRFVMIGITILVNFLFHSEILTDFIVVISLILKFQLIID